MAFRGHYEHSLDAKHRLSIPARFRAPLSDALVMSIDPDGCATLSTPDGLGSVMDRALEGKNPLGSQYKAIRRYYEANSFDTELDGSGRVTFPGPLLRHAGIEKDVVVAGVGDHVEIWSAERWDAQQQALAESIGEVAEGLGDPS